MEITGSIWLNGRWFKDTGIFIKLLYFMINGFCLFFVCIKCKGVFSLVF